MQYQAAVAIVGAGVASLMAVPKLARSGKQVLVIDRDSAKNIGDLAHLALLH